MATVALTLSEREARILAVLVSANESQLRELEVSEADADSLRERLDAEGAAVAKRDRHFLNRGFAYAAGVMEPGVPVQLIAEAYAAGRREAGK